MSLCDPKTGVCKSMGRVCLMVFLLVLSQVTVLCSSQEEEDGQNRTRCKFSCGQLGTLKFPFIPKNGSPSCGFLEVDGCNSEVQKIRLDRGTEKWYPIFSITVGDSIIIHDDDLSRQRLSLNSCQTFNNGLTLPSSSFFSFSISPNLTFLTCDPSVNVSLERVPTNCTNSSVYYVPPGPESQRPPPPLCKLILLPEVPSEQGRTYSSLKGHNLSALLTANFSVVVNVSHACSKCYYRNRGVCLENSKHEFYCSKKGKKNLGLKVGLGISNGMLLMLIVIYIIWRYHQRKRASTKLLKSTSSSDPFFKDDLEGGSVYFGVPVFSYRELEVATNSFSSENEIGDGGFGIVYFGKLGDGREVAVKRMYAHNYRRVEQFMNEIKILTQMRHKNLVSLYGCTSRRSKELLLVYEYIPNGTVADHLHGDRAEDGPLTWPIRMSIAIETASALAYLHASGIIHRDVKTNNILLDNSCSVKVADFGLSRLFPGDRTHVSTAPQGTPGYVDPEYHQCYQLTDKSDVYSFGVVLVELISSMPAVDISRDRSDINLANLAVRKIKECAVDELIDPWLDHKRNGEIKPSASSVAELAFRCLQLEKEMRPTMVEIVEELIRIQSEDSKCNQEEDHDGNNKNIKKIPPPPSPDQEEDSLLKNPRHLPSPISVTDKWTSTSSIATTSDTCG